MIPLVPFAKREYEVCREHPSGVGCLPALLAVPLVLRRRPHLYRNSSVMNGGSKPPWYRKLGLGTPALRARLLHGRGKPLRWDCPS